MTLELFTAAYPKFRPEHGVPVRASNGSPKYRLAYELREVARLIIPKWSLVQDRTISDAEFGRRYEADLDAVGLDRIAAEFRAIADRNEDDRLVVMCFEKSPTSCHRGDFARWWEKVTGQPVSEVGPVVPPSAPVPPYEPPATLF